MRGRFCKFRHLVPAATLALAVGTVALADAPTPSRAPPQVLFKDLFAEVQNRRLYGDGKNFVDAVPRFPPARILAAYHRERPKDDAALKAFVAAHFSLPEPAATAPSPPTQVPILEHIDRLWSVLTRRTPSAPEYASLLTLPQPYVVPGGRFREIYYWDSYFTMLGLVESGRSDLLDSMVFDFAYLIDTYGHIPNGTRTYYLSRSQPPFFYAMVGLLSPNDSGAAYAKYLPELKREYAFWMEGERTLRPGESHRHLVALADGSKLNRYWDDRDTPRDEAFREDGEVARASHRPPEQVYRDLRAAAESGWDFGSRWFADGKTRESIVTTDIVPVDLNSLMFGLETAIAAGCAHAKADCAAEFQERAQRRARAMRTYLKDPGGVLYDYRISKGERLTRPSGAILYPLFAGLAARDEAAAIAAKTRQELLRSGGLVTSTQDTQQQWDSPNGWAPLQWIAVAGLRSYEQADLAAAIACRFIANVNDVYVKSGKLVEKYDVITTGRSGGGGEYPSQDGFGWTNGVTARLMHLYPAFAKASLSDCSR